jgi:hypothetical protein
MEKKLLDNFYWVAEDGSYGRCNLYVFSGDFITEKEWDAIADVSDNDRLSYAITVSNGQKWEEE